jgi:hypothetical protein
VLKVVGMSPVAGGCFARKVLEVLQGPDELGGSGVTSSAFTEYRLTECGGWL